MRLKPDINNGALHEDRCTLVIIPRWILLVTRNVSDKVVEKIKTHFVFNNFFLLSFFFQKSCPLRDNVENMAGSDRQAQLTV